MTFEDNIHQGAVETYFLTSLREMDAERISRAKKSSTKPNKDTENYKEGRMIEQAITGPPAFYEEDLNKWMTKKFARAIS